MFAFEDVLLFVFENLSTFLESTVLFPVKNNIFFLYIAMVLLTTDNGIAFLQEGLYFVTFH